MLKIHSGVSIITLSLVGLSDDTFKYLEHQDHGISLLDGTSAVKNLKSVLAQINAVRVENDRSIDRVNQVIGIVKSIVSNSDGPEKARFQAHLDQGRSHQERITATGEQIATIIDDINKLLPWALKYDNPLAETIETKDPKSIIPTVGDTITSLLDELNNAAGVTVGSDEPCCGFCGGPHETPGNKDQEDALSLLAQRVFGARPKLHEAFKGFSGKAIDDFVKGMMESSVPNEEHFDVPAKNVDVESLVSMSKEVPGTGGRVRYIKAPVEELAKLFGVSEEKMRERAISMPFGK